MIAADLAHRCQGKLGPSGVWSCRCPVHDDKTRSMSIRDGDKGILITCHRGCSPEDICVALGLDVKELFYDHDKKGLGRDLRPRPRGDEMTSRNAVPSRIVQTYDYVNALGEMLYQVCRMEPKTFRQRRPNGRGGWIWDRGDAEEVLYRLPEVIEAVAQGRGIYLVEGEKDVEAIRARGGCATTSSGGADHWQDRYATDLVGAHVVILPDHDDPGESYAGAACKSLMGKAASVRIVRLPGLPQKGDVSDWLAAGHELSELVELVERTPEEKPPPPPPWEIYPGPEQTRAQLHEKPPPLDWLFDATLPRGIIAGLTAPGGTGKGFLFLELLHRAALGHRYGPFRPTRPLKSLYLVGEDIQHVLDLRYWDIARGNNPEGFHYISRAGTCGPLVESTPGGIVKKTHWYQWLDHTLSLYDGLDILVLDPRSRFYGLDENDNDSATQWCNIVEELVAKHRILLWVVHHVSKAVIGQDLSSARSRGASAFVDACRTVFDLGTVSPQEAKRFSCDAKNTLKLDIVKTNVGPYWREPAYFRRGEFGLLEPWTPTDCTSEAVCTAIPLALAGHRGSVSMAELKNRKAKEFFAAVECRVEGLTWEDLVAGVEKCLSEGRIFERCRQGKNGTSTATLSLMKQE